MIAFEISRFQGLELQGVVVASKLRPMSADPVIFKD
jgi:hypothetical protein